jgi:hypothetical protein
MLHLAIEAQIPGPNVNMVSGTKWPDGDPFLQRQNEPSLAVSTRNPLHLLAGANDYRTVDLPGLPDGEETGDAWLGLFKSFDGGLTWRSNLVPGYPQDNSPDGLASPIKGLQAGADPVVRAGTNGLFFYSGIAFNRGDGAIGKIFVTRFIDGNNKENGDPIKYLGTVVVASGGAEGFIDKPWLAVDIPRLGARLVQVNGKWLFAGNIYIAYSVIQGTGTNTQTKIIFAKSSDLGATWSTPRAISTDSQINQGVTIAIDPRTGEIFIAWRRFHTSTQSDAIMVTRSKNGGKSFTPPKAIASINPFDQGSTTVSFRTNAYPTMAIDDAGRAYLAWSQRGVGPGGDARIVLSTWQKPVGEQEGDDEDVGDLDDQDNIGAGHWSPPQPIDNAQTRGHQIMPALAFNAGKLTVVYYDLREDTTLGIFTQALGTGLFSETRQPVGDLAAPSQPDKVFTNYVMDAAPQGFDHLKRRHTIDVRVAQADPGSAPIFTAPSPRVSQYKFGSRPGSATIEQLQINPTNLPLFKRGTVPFAGDYVDLAGSPPFVPGLFGIWTYNTNRSNSSVFHASWTTNQDVRPPAGSPPDWTKYTPVHSDSNNGTSKFDPTQAVPQCDPANTGSRNQNIYTSRISEGLVVGSPGNAKPLGTIQFNGKQVLLQRAFVVFATNTSDETKSFRLIIANQPADVPNGRASFAQFPLPPFTSSSPPPVTQLDVTLPRHSGASRTVFVTSLNRHAQVTVNVVEISAPADPAPLSGGLQSSVVLNPDIANPDIANPDIANPNIANPDIANAEVYNPDIANPDIANPDIANPDIANPDIANPDIANPDIANPDIANPDIANPDIANPDIANPDIANPDIANGSVSDTTDATWPITNNGNTSAAYSVKLLLNRPLPPSSIKFQLILHKTYETPVARGCNLGTEKHQIIIANITRPQFTDVAHLIDPDTGNPNVPTLSLAPGETAKITLRIFNKSNFNPRTDVTPVVVAQAVNTKDALAGVTQPPVTLTIITSSLPAGNGGAPYSATLLAIGGIGQLTWSLVPPFDPETGLPLDCTSCPGSLPPGLSLSTAGVISGTPTRAGTYRFQVKVTDSGSSPRSVTRNLVLVINGANLTFVTQPTDTPAGQAVRPSIQVRAFDNSGSVLPAVPVTMSIGVNPTGGALSGTTVVNTDATGVATFPDLGISEGGDGYTLIASAGGGSVVSNSFNVRGPITFEVFPNGTPACDSCALTDQFASRGVVFAFASQFTSLQNAQLFNSAAYDPPNGPINHSVTSAAAPPPDGGFYSGVVSMMFPTAPTSLSFQARLNNSIETYQVTASDPLGNDIPASQIVRSNSSTYTSGGGFVFRQETLTISNPGGVARVHINMNGFLVLIDNLSPTP